MAYLFPWIFLIFGSLVAGVSLFIWAYHSGQLSDQGRARYLPLRGMGIDPEKGNGADILSTKMPYELFALLTGAIAVLLFTLVFVLLNKKGG